MRFLFYGGDKKEYSHTKDTKKYSRDNMRIDFTKDISREFYGRWLYLNEERF